MFGIIPRPGIPDVCKEAIANLCLNIQAGFKMVRKKNQGIPFKSPLLKTGQNLLNKRNRRTE